MNEKGKNRDGELRDMLGKLLGADNLPDDCVINAILNDQRLIKIAEYEVTKGNTDFNTPTPETLQAKFTEFKQLVLAKSSTLAELETTVFSRYGVLEKPRINAPLDQISLSDLNGIKFTDKKPISGFNTNTEGS